MSIDYKVTVYCPVFNHEKYIRETLNGFVSQKTNFPFRVIVHDDASTDKSTSIIREYAEKYPEIIFPIFQSENQYSKGVNTFNKYIIPLITTEYVASCEGDDYWTDDNKLQIQYDYMEMHPECPLCVHNTSFINEDGSSTGRIFNCDREDRDYSAEDCIIACGGGIFHTSSRFYRLSIAKSRPEWMDIPGIGDYPFAMWMSMNGNVHYIARCMSAYRLNAVGSWSQRNRNNYTQVSRNVIAQLVVINMRTNYTYASAIQEAIGTYQYEIYRAEGNLWTILTTSNIRKVFFNQSFVGVVRSTCAIIRNRLKLK